MHNHKTTADVALGIRRRVFEHAIRNNGGYLSQACSAAEQLAWLYHEELHLGAPTLPLVPSHLLGCHRLIIQNTKQEQAITAQQNQSLIAYLSPPHIMLWLPMPP